MFVSTIENLTYTIEKIENGFIVRIAEPTNVPQADPDQFRNYLQAVREIISGDKTPVTESETLSPEVMAALTKKPKKSIETFVFGEIDEAFDFIRRHCNEYAE